MITLTQLKAKAEQKYIQVLKAWVLEEEIFPLNIPADKKLDKTQGKDHIFDQQKELIAQSKPKTGKGFSLKTKENSKTNESEIREIFFETREDLLYFISKKEEFDYFQHEAQFIFKAIPGLKGLLAQYPKRIIEGHGKWEHLVLVCQFFMQNPQPRLYARSLPIPISTKFVETNQRLLRFLLDFLIPNETSLDESNFFKRYHLLFGEPSVTLRFLDPMLSLHPALSQMGILVSELAEYAPSCRKVFIIENQASFLSFPKFPISMAIWGGGFAVNLLKDVRWLADKEVYYWGDIDVHGFQILSQIRGIFPEIQSLMMDSATFTRFYKNLKGNNFVKSLLPNLNQKELQFYQQIEANNYRLEQEKIPIEYVIETVKSL